ncbi:phosphatase 2C-like domain-containing protein [Suillus paluster]|uniref:phosphatase 2C-like domain-containing protein n=1 Tax=Suillus paluster TaxID=48578 RepID=UPI001B8682BC|nr:phosphatase 2C-like domain-containing protein [Suillus paluster]KAG1756795.1 phosphatase 2C-like domain-containing protein [Suillus paluster]
MTLGPWSSSVSRLVTRKGTCILGSVSQRAHRPITRTYSDTGPVPPQPRPYQLHFGASWAAKPPDPLRIHVPFPSDTAVGSWRDGMLRRWKHVMSKDAGEDFFFVTEMQNNSGVSFGVADGVGGWVDSGVDPSLFAQTLMYHAHQIDPTQEYEERERVEGWELTPYKCLECAYHAVLRERRVNAGSSTACLISINSSSGVLRAANLGDSGFLIIRSSSVIYRQPPQTHFFQLPILTKLPSNMAESDHLADHPNQAAQYETKLRDGDIIIAFTDGLSDNVFTSDLVAICSFVARSGGSEDAQAQMMANHIVEYAQVRMRDRKKMSPFSREALREGLYYRGGVPLVRETV